MRIPRETTGLLRRNAETLNNFILTYFSSKFPQLFRDRAIKRFRADTYRCFYMDDKPIDWGNILQPAGNGYLAVKNQFVVRYRGIILGHVSMITSRDGGKSIKVEHFAVSYDFIGAGVAIIMAQVLRAKFREHYNTKIIIFDENHSRFSERTYPQFFTRLGAKNSDVNQPTKWEWDISQSPSEKSGSATDAA